MNRQIRWLTIFLMMCMVLLFVRMNQIQIFEADKLTNRADNSRKIVRDFNNDRGLITTVDGHVVALTEVTEGQLKRQRVYPDNELYSQVAGYYSFSYGAIGVERAYNDELAGQTDAQQLKRFTDLFDANNNNVGNVELTLNHELQQVAQDALGSQKGSVVALDP